MPPAITSSSASVPVSGEKTDAALITALTSPKYGAVYAFRSEPLYFINRLNPVSPTTPPINLVPSTALSAAIIAKAVSI